MVYSSCAIAIWKRRRTTQIGRRHTFQRWLV